MPKYLIAVYGLDIRMAAAIAFSLPAGLPRVVGGVLADHYGARRVMYWSLIGSMNCTFILSYPATDDTVHGATGELRFTLAQRREIRSSGGQPAPMHMSGGIRLPMALSI